MRKLWIIRSLIGVSVLAMPLTLISTAVIFNPFNPMQTAFITKFTVHNGTAQPIFITPIGTANRHRESKIIMRQFNGKSPAYEKRDRTNHRVDPGTSLEVYYESDNYCLSEIAIKDETGNFHQLDIDRSVTGCDQVYPKEATFRVELLDRLKVINPRIQNMITTSKKPSVLFSTPMVILGFVPIPLLIFSLLAHRKLSKRLKTLNPPSFSEA